MRFPHAFTAEMKNPFSIGKPNTSQHKKGDIVEEMCYGSLAIPNARIKTSSTINLKRGDHEDLQRHKGSGEDGHEGRGAHPGNLGARVGGVGRSGSGARGLGGWGGAGAGWVGSLIGRRGRAAGWGSSIGNGRRARRGGHDAEGASRSGHGSRCSDTPSGQLALFGASVDIVRALVVALENVGLNLAHAGIIKWSARREPVVLGTQADEENSLARTA